MASVKSRIYPGWRYHVKERRIQPSSRAYTADVVPAMVRPEIVRRPRVVVYVHDESTPRNNGISVGVASSPVALSLRRGTPTSAVNTPFS